MGTPSNSYETTLATHPKLKDRDSMEVGDSYSPSKNDKSHVSSNSDSNHPHLKNGRQAIRSFDECTQRPMEFEEHDSGTHMLELDPHRMVVPFTREFVGCTVQFDAVGKIRNSKIESDYSSVEIMELPIGVKVERVSQELSVMTRIDVPHSAIKLKSLGPKKLVTAVVTVQDSSFAQLVFNGILQTGSFLRKKVRLRPIPGAYQTGLWSRSMNLSSIDVHWRRVSHSVSFRYSKFDIPERPDKARKILDGLIVRGRELSAYIRSAPSSQQSKVTIYLQVNNLHPETTARHVDDLLPPEAKPDELIDERADTFEAEYALEKAIWSLIGNTEKLNSLLSIEVDSRPSREHTMANVHFLHPKAAVAAVASLQNLRDSNPTSSLNPIVRYQPYIDYTVPLPIFNAIMPDINETMTRIWGHPMTFNLLKAVDSSSVTQGFRIGGKNLEDLQRAKKVVEWLLAGLVIKDREEIVWHSDFANPAFLTCLATMSNFHNVYIVRDVESRRLTVYGGSISTKVVVNRKLVQILAATVKAQEVSQEFCNTQEGVLSSETNNVILDCPICFCAVENPIKAYCGHRYCENCFSEFVQHVDCGSLPLTCCGNYGTCDHGFTLDELEALLPSSRFEALLQKSWKHHVMTHPNNFRNCSTPDCKQIYRITDSPAVDFCTVCLAAHCTACGSEPHKGMSCEEFKDLRSGGYNALENWISQQRHVKKCPSCATPIELIFGCSHMKCQCGEHFCWICLKRFGKVEQALDIETTSSYKTYMHSREVHGGLGGGEFPEPGFA